jgi:hypothetical protein
MLDSSQGSLFVTKIAVENDFSPHSIPVMARREDQMETA